MNCQNQKCRYCWVLACICWFTAFVFAHGAEVAGKRAEISVLTQANWIQAAHPLTLSERELKKLQVVPGFDAGQMKGCQVPKNWKFNPSHYVSASSFPLFSEVVKENDGVAWHVKTEGYVVFFASRPPIPPWYNYRIRITMRGKGTVTPFLYGSSTGQAPTLAGPVIPATDIYTVHEAEMTDIGNNQLAIPRKLALRFSGDITVKTVELVAVSNVGDSVIDGEVLAVSKLPKITSADYPDCNYTVKFQVNRLIRGEPTNRIIQIVCPGFIDGKRGAYADLHPGDKLALSLAWFDALPESIRSNKLFDTLLEFDLESYYLLNAKAVTELSEPDVVFKDSVSYKSRFQADKPLNPPLPERAVKERLRQMEEDKSMLEQRLAAVGNHDEWNRRFSEYWRKNQAQCQRLGQCYSSRTRNYVDMSRLFWGQVGQGFFALPEKFQLFRLVNFPQENIVALQALKDYLKLNNIQLIVAVHPDYYDLSAHMLNPELGDLIDVNSALLVKTLLEADIEAVYTFDELKRTAGDYEFSFLYPDNDHPGWGTQDAIARLLAKRLERFAPGELGPNVPAKAFTYEMKSGWGGDAIRYPAGVSSGTHEPDTPVIQKIYSINGADHVSDPHSSILIIGNSHIQSPMPTGSLSVALARQSGILSHSYYAGGNGPAYVIPSNLMMRPETYLRGKKVCIYLFNQHLAQLELLNVRDFDRIRTLISGRNIVAEIVLRSAPEQVFRPTGSFEDRIWADFIKSYPNLSQIIGAGQKQTLYHEILPKAAKGTPDELFLYLSFAQYPGYPFTLHVNGVPHRFNVITRPMWRNEVLPVTPDSSGYLTVELGGGVAGRPVMLLRQAKVLR